MNGDPILFFDKPHPLLVRCILAKKKKFWTWEDLILLLFLLKYDRIFLRMQVYVTFNYPLVGLILPEETILQPKFTKYAYLRWNE